VLRGVVGKGRRSIRSDAARSSSVEGGGRGGRVGRGGSEKSGVAWITSSNGLS